ncbi:phosphoribosylformylglycinamidine cyclo-ligase [Anaerovibrio lipolyticus]|uniref:phosphoribosylformylglycinamidine cyclo-ligase n=1 Tax=Anaerovibrio lipolyticus TaxID=82374 RepID=UPI0026EC7236|nr:phosphoribosylformylglycinamidine cyclo-ligase [Anaerovibrio lipolyticus]MBE6105308.1 phosphoribosylformylglycinamidine cyclo-ligase [Anaerovibrio lipolyticus]
MKIRIGDAVSLTTPIDFKFHPDDRQTLVQTDGGNVVQDFGSVASGDKITLNAVFKRDEFLKVWNYYQSRELVAFTDSSGVVWPQMRVRILAYGYKERFENYINCEIELWRI